MACEREDVQKEVEYTGEIEAQTEKEAVTQMETSYDDRYQLTIKGKGKEITFSSQELLSRKDIEELTFKDVAAYPKKEMSYKAIKFANLLEELQLGRDSTLVFIAEDDFAAPIRSEVLSNTSPDNSIAYLAIEEANNKWPPFRSGYGTAGPFYVFWLNPELSNIGREEWPYKFNLIKIQDSFDSLYPNIKPDHSIPDDSDIMLGYKSFVKNCFACHKLDQTGPGIMGPDLNYPMSPTEYYREGILEKLVRNPENIRHNPQGVMAGFNEEEISDLELGQLLKYLAHMASRDN